MPLASNEQTVLISLAVALGALVGFGALGFGYLLNFIQSLFFVQTVSLEHPDDLPQAAGQLPFWAILLAPALGGLIVGPLVTRYASEARGHGIPEVMESVALRGGRIRRRVALVKIFASACTIGSGGSAGKEGPIGQIGAALGSFLSQTLRLSPNRTRTLVACGAAAGIAATFNAPIAGSIFAVEVIVGGIALSSLSPIILCAVIATVTARAFKGNVLLLDIPQSIKALYTMVSPFEVITYAVLGVGAAAAAVLYIKTLYGFEDLFDRLKALPDWMKPMIGGLGVGALALLFPEVLSQGFETVQCALLQEPGATWELLLLLLIAKILATGLTLGSGGSGGVFAPSLFIGAMLGGAYGQGVNSLFPDLTASPGAYALVGMGAVVAAATHAPISSILILFEMTDNYRIVLPLMLAAVLGTAISSQGLGLSIYTCKLKRRGVTLKGGLEQEILRTVTIREGSIQKPATLREDTTFQNMLKVMVGGNLQDYPVVDREGALVGLVSFGTLREFVFEKEVGNLIIARELMRDDFTPLTLEDSLLTALDRFAASDRQEIPVVRQEDSTRMIGVVSRQDIMDTYQRELRKRITAQ